MLSSRLRVVLIATCVATTAAFMSPVHATEAMAPLGTVAADPPDDTPVLLTPKGEREDEAEEQGFDKLRDAYYWIRLLSGNEPLTIGKAARLRVKATKQASKIHSLVPAGARRGGVWTGQGPDPIVQVGRTSNTFQAVTGRIGA